jgi:hypothetical protein
MFVMMGVLGTHTVKHTHGCSPLHIWTNSLYALSWSSGTPCYPLEQTHGCFPTPYLDKQLVCLVAVLGHPLAREVHVGQPKLGAGVELLSS